MQKQQSKQNERILISKKFHTEKITQFQLKMARQLQNTQLNEQKVRKAIEYLSDHQELGFYVIKQIQGIAIGQLLVAAITEDSWWFASVYIDQNYRGKGHFRSLFNEVYRMGREKGLKSIKNYVGIQQNMLIKMYESFGMSLTGQQFYTFVIGDNKQYINRKYLQQSKQNIQGNRIQIRRQRICRQVIDNCRDILCNEQKVQIRGDDRYVVIYIDGEKIGVIGYLRQYTQWQFSWIYMIQNYWIDESKLNIENKIITKNSDIITKNSDIIVNNSDIIVNNSSIDNNNELINVSQIQLSYKKQINTQIATSIANNTNKMINKQIMNKINNQLIQYWLNQQQQVNIYSIRYLFNKNNSNIINILDNGHIQHYQVMNINLSSQ